jgi:hypothetical protein
MTRVVPRLLLAALALAATTCGSDTTTTQPDPTEFIAFTSSFAGFRNWTAFHSDGPAPGSVTPDVLGPRTQYINKVPQHRTDEFPVGTIIVEAREAGAQLIFAAVKRGGDFNVAGARNWEWFELQENGDGTVTIPWRGFGPPAGSTMYGGSDRCNLCHAGCDSNDFVCSQKLQLQDF